MSKTVIVVTMVLMTVVVRAAETQLAEVTSSAAFTLRGAGITPGTGVSIWPVLAGDKVKAGITPTIVTFPEGSVFTLAPASEARIELVNGKPAFRLLSGTATYSLKSITAVQLMTANQVEVVQDLSGTMTLGAAQAPATSFWTAGHIAAVAVASGAVVAGAGVGIAHAVSGGAAVSPSK